jgi:hypothetical protein
MDTWINLGVTNIKHARSALFMISAFHSPWLVDAKRDNEDRF